MKIAVIETGFIPHELEKKHISYSKMFFKLLKNHFPKAKIKIYKLYENKKLPESFSFDLFVISG